MYLLCLTKVYYKSLANIIFSTALVILLHKWAVIYLVYMMSREVGLLILEQCSGTKWEKWLVISPATVQEQPPMMEHKTNQSGENFSWTNSFDDISCVGLSFCFLWPTTFCPYHLANGMLFDQDISYIHIFCDMQDGRMLVEFTMKCCRDLICCCNINDWVRVDCRTYVRSSWCKCWLMREEMLSQKNCTRSWLQWCQRFNHHSHP